MGQEADASLSEGVATIAEAMAFCSLSRATLYRLMDAGKLPYVKAGRARRIPRRALKDYLARCLTTGAYVASSEG